MDQRPVADDHYANGVRLMRETFTLVRPGGQPPSRRGVGISGLITGNASGNGKYTGKSFNDITTDVSASGTLAESDCGTLATSNDCLILNLTELGSSTTGHDLTAAANTSQFSLYFVGRLLRVNSDGTKVVQIAQTYTGC